MTKQEYIQLREQNNLILLWFYYVEECKDREQLIQHPQELLQFLSMWRNINEIYSDVIRKLDIKFAVTKIYNTEQQIIGII